MTSIFDIINNNPVENFRKAFFDVTGTSISFADEEHKQYNTFYAGSRCEFCRIMNSSLTGLEHCVKTSRDAGKIAAKSGEALIYTCHAGLKEVVVPIIINGKHIGSVFSGQVMTEKPTDKKFSDIEDYFCSLGLNDEEVRQEYMKIPAIPQWKLELISKMLKIIVDYIIQSEISQSLRDKVNKERDKLRGIIPYIKSQFVNYIITNNTDKLIEIKEKIMYLGIKSVPNTVVFLKVNDMRSDKSKVPESKFYEKDLLVDLISLELNRIRDVLIHAIDNDSIAVFVHIKENLQESHKKESALRIAGRISSIIKEKTIFTATIGISRCRKSSIELSNAYREAFNACTYGAFIGDDQIVHIDDIQAEGKSGSMIFDSEKVRKNIILADEKELTGIYYNIFHQVLLNDKFDLDRIKVYTMEFMNEVLSSAIQIGLDDSYSSKRIAYYQQLIGLSAIQDVYSWGKGIITSVIDDVASGRTSRNKKIIESAKRHIEENYHEDLNLEDIASVVYLSPNYFGWLFKKETGESYIEYLTRIRVGKAILLMKTTKESIESISEMVGYKDPNYFSQVFKKVEGVRPSTYRKKL